MAILISYSSSIKSFLISSVNFWFFLSLLFSTLSLASFSFTTFYATHFAPLGTLILSLIVTTVIALHCFIFLSHNPLRTLLSHRPLGLYLEICAAVPLFIAGMSLFFFPEFESAAGLLFVMCVDVDALAVAQIVRSPALSSALLCQISGVAMVRAMSLYSNLGAFLMFLFTSVLIAVNLFVDNAIYEAKLAEELPILFDDIV
ncbi:hypothetical protein LguiB_004220 [Lonicera macranthoides]